MITLALEAGAYIHVHKKIKIIPTILFLEILKCLNIISRFFPLTRDRYLTVKKEMNRIGALRKKNKFFLDSALEQNCKNQIPEQHYFDSIN